MPQTIKIIPSEFINAEPGLLPVGNIPVIVLSFNDEKGCVEDRAVSIGDAQQVVIDTVKCLAQMGDPWADALVKVFFGNHQ